MKKIKLSDGKTIAMRKPKVKDIKAVSHIKDDEEKEIMLFANLTETDPSEIEDMFLEDYTKLQEAYTGLAYGM